mmetsp:Transcript_35829/g.93792  ORF Transcript_35829/g.93792 Transcript_35829/m.93792 type:complete len:233 (-) Transcript_35829:7-705(-)
MLPFPNLEGPRGQQIRGHHVAHEPDAHEAGDFVGGQGLDYVGGLHAEHCLEQKFPAEGGCQRSHLHVIHKLRHAQLLLRRRVVRSAHLQVLQRPAVNQIGDLHVGPLVPSGNAVLNQHLVVLQHDGRLPICNSRPVHHGWLLAVRGGYRGALVGHLLHATVRQHRHNPNKNVLQKYTALACRFGCGSSFCLSSVCGGSCLLGRRVVFGHIPCVQGPLPFQTEPGENQTPLQA